MGRCSRGSMKPAFSPSSLRRSVPGSTRSWSRRWTRTEMTSGAFGRPRCWPRPRPTPDGISTAGCSSPFARTLQERMSTGDPRLSLEERYGTHAGYVDAVRKATQTLVKQRLLLQVDADRLIGAADGSDILK